MWFKSLMPSQKILLIFLIKQGISRSLSGSVSLLKVASIQIPKSVIFTKGENSLILSIPLRLTFPCQTYLQVPWGTKGLLSNWKKRQEVQNDATEKHLPCKPLSLDIWHSIGAEPEIAGTSDVIQPTITQILEHQHWLQSLFSEVIALLIAIAIFLRSNTQGDSSNI